MDQHARDPTVLAKYFKGIGVGKGTINVSITTTPGVLNPKAAARKAAVADRRGNRLTKTNACSISLRVAKVNGQMIYGDVRNEKGRHW